MPKNITLKKLILNLKKLGFDGPHSGGKHFFMIKESLKLHIPNDHKSDISAGLVNEILRQAGIDKKEWDNL